MAGFNLLDVLTQLGNKSGAIKSAPPALKKLKESIQGVPFELLRPGMSGVMDVGKILQGIAKMAPAMGGLTNMGSFQSILGQLTAGQQAQAQGGALPASLTVAQLEKALGSGGAIGVALSAFASD